MPNDWRLKVNSLIAIHTVHVCMQQSLKFLQKDFLATYKNGRNQLNLGKDSQEVRRTRCSLARKPGMA